MSAVYKYEIPVDDESHEIPGFVVHVGAKTAGTLFAWSLVDPDDLSETEPYRVYGTGHRVPEGALWFGTVEAPPFVWHVFNVLDVKQGDL